MFCQYVLFIEIGFLLLLPRSRTNELRENQIYRKIFLRPIRLSPGEKAFSGNNCPESKPWPCKTPGVCLSFDFICDGEKDCDDNYDEDENLCTAKNRPPFIILNQFITKYKDWLIPNYLGSGTPEKVSTHLIESKNDQEYIKSMNMTPEEAENFKSLLESVKEGRQIELIMFGMPPRAWNELSILFGRIVKSGFMT